MDEDPYIVTMQMFGVRNFNLELLDVELALHNSTKDALIKELKFPPDNMNRYVWSMDNRILSEVDKIPVKKGEILRITIYNNSMMRHPMHLHGFDFRVINGKGEYSHPFSKCL